MPEPTPEARVLTLANGLSMARILLVPFFLLAVLAHDALAALLVFSAAGLTDLLDGMAARGLRQRTKLGLLLDPAADKILLTAAYIICTIPSLSTPNAVPLWLTAFIISRDVAIALGALLLWRLVRKATFLPSLLGKFSTAFQVGCVFLVLLFNALDLAAGALVWMFAVTFALTLLSGAHYFVWAFLGEFRRAKS